MAATNEMRCPDCDSTDIGEAGKVAVTARGRWRYLDGAVDFEPIGDTEVYWDSQEADDDLPCHCQGCGNFFDIGNLKKTEAVVNTGSRDEQRMLSNIARIAQSLEGIYATLVRIANAAEEQAYGVSGSELAKVRAQLAEDAREKP